MLTVAKSLRAAVQSLDMRGVRAHSFGQSPHSSRSLGLGAPCAELGVGNGRPTVRCLGNRRQASSFPIARFERQPAARHAHGHARARFHKTASFADTYWRSNVLMAPLYQRGEDVPHGPESSVVISELAQGHVA